MKFASSIDIFIFEEVHRNRQKEVKKADTRDTKILVTKLKNNRNGSRATISTNSLSLALDTLELL